MDKPSAEAAFSLKRTSDGAPVSGSFGWYGPGVLIFKPTADLAPGTQYTASVSTAAKDLAGQPAGGREELAVHDREPPESSTASPRPTARPTSPPARWPIAVFNKAMDKPSAEAAFSLKRTSDGAAGERQLRLVRPRRADLQAQRRPGARDAIHGERLDRRQGPRRATRWRPRRAGSSRPSNPPSRQQRLPGRRRDRRRPSAVAYRRLQQGDGQALRRGRLLAEANQRRGAGERQLRLVRPRRADLQARPPTWRPGRNTRRASRPPPRTSPGTRWRPRRAGSSRPRTRRVVNSVSPADGATDVAPSSVAYAFFNKAMDKPSAEAAFSLKRTSDGAPVSGSFGWYGPGALIFKPTPTWRPGRNTRRASRPPPRTSPATRSPTRSPGAIRREPPARAVSG